MVIIDNDLFIHAIVPRHVETVCLMSRVELEKYYPDVKYVNRLMTHSWGQKVIRFYDPDGNLIEVGTPM